MRFNIKLDIVENRISKQEEKSKAITRIKPKKTNWFRTIYIHIHKRVESMVEYSHTLKKYPGN